MNKVCKGCGQNKPLTEFSNKNTAKDGKHSRCKECTRLYTRRHYSENKSYYIKKSKSSLEVNREYVWDLLKKNSCVDCGNENPLVLEFDHLGFQEKEGNISQLIKTSGLKTVKNEIEKCEIICANCHRIRTYKRLNCWQYRQYRQYRQYENNKAPLV